MIYVSRRYRFSAAHRLHNETLTAEENARLYGKCNSPYGHGHNYVLEVTVAGPVDPSTGMVCDLAVLDCIVEEEILDRFDHANLNLDVESFRARVPTAENLCVEVFQLLEQKFAGNGRSGRARLASVRLEETSSNFFEYKGEREGTKTSGEVR